MSINRYYFTVLVVFSLLSLPSLCASVHAATESATTEVERSDIPALSPVVVEAQRIAPTTGTVILDSELIEDLPTRNGSVNELIGIVPAVQYSEEYNSSLSGGEITPPPVSISGSRSYDNNYTIDGLDNTSILNPDYASYQDAYRLPGNAQKQFLSPRLIDQITTYNSNIPAEFGGFTGGQINVKTIEPAPDFWGQLSYRSTSDRWTEFHIDKQDEEDFYAAKNSAYQPEFNKHDFGLILNTPLTEDSALLTAYQQVLSRIEYKHLDQSKTGRREKENFLLKGSHYLDSTTQVTLTGLYSPTRGSYFLEDHRNSDYSIEQESYSTNLQAEKDFPLGQLTLQVGYSVQEIRRDAQANRFIWDAKDEEPNREGGNGDLEYGEKEFSSKTTFSFTPVDIKETNHHITTGIEASHAKTSYYRPSASSTYSYAQVDSATVCSPDDPACVAGDRYLKNLTTYSAAENSTSNNQLRLFVQDSVSWKRLELFPGLRINYDSLTDDINLAPRVSASYDLFGNGATILFAGRNKYYSSTLLEPGQYSYTVYSRNGSSEDWYVKNHNTFTTADIKAPYTHETTAGVIQKMLGGDLKAQYIYKKTKDEFARTLLKTTDDVSGITYNTYYLNNSGRSEYKSILVSWQRSWLKHQLEINGTWQKSTTSNSSYLSTFDAEDATETYWYDDKEYYKYEKPKTDFSRPTVINIIYRWKLLDSLTFSNTTKYRDKYWTLKAVGTEPSILNPDQEKDPIVYQKVKAKSAIIFDWSLAWEIPASRYYTAVLNLDILNVFNKRNKRGYQTGKYGYDYEIGRQFWLGIDVNF